MNPRVYVMPDGLSDVEKDGAMQEENLDLNTKRDAIATACQHADLGKLIALANSEGGLLHDDLRATACE